MLYESDLLPAGSVDLECLYRGSMLRSQLLVTLYTLAIAENPILQSSFCDAADIVQAGCHVSRKAAKLLAHFEKGCSENELMDVSSHFCTRLAACSRKDTRVMLMVAECLLFSLRYTNMNPSNMSQFLLKHKSKDLFRYLPVNTKDTLDMLCVAICKKDDSYIVRIPWTYSLDQVSARSVVLDNGAACVPCTYLLEACVDDYYTVLRNGLDSAKTAYGTVVSDERMAELLPQVTCWLEAGCQVRGGRDHNRATPTHQLSIEDVDKISVMFPMCMQRLHHTLRKKHRLSHTFRIQYTLFLKSIGLGMEDAIEFWKSEYSKPHSDCQAGGCSHNWSSDKQRYMYSIRHLYGREGRMVDYSPHSCHTLQNQVINPTHEGGCPFKHSDKDSLYTTLHSDKLATSDIEDIMQLASTGQYSVACKLHHTARVNLVVQASDKTNGKTEIPSSMTPIECECIHSTKLTDPELPTSAKELFFNPAEYFSSFVDEIPSDS